MGEFEWGGIYFGDFFSHEIWAVNKATWFSLFLLGFIFIALSKIVSKAE